MKKLLFNLAILCLVSYYSCSNHKRPGGCCAPPLSMAGTGFTPSLAVSNDGIPHISFIEERFDNKLGRQMYLKHTEKNNGEWKNEKIFKNDYLDINNQKMALDTNGFVHIIYGERSTDYVGVKYASNKDATWSSETISSETDNDTMYGSDIVIGEHPTVLYFKDLPFHSSSLNLAERINGKWESNKIFEQIFNCCYGDFRYYYKLLTNDDKGNLIIGLNSLESSRGVEYLYRTDTWNVEKVIATGNYEENISINDSGEVEIIANYYRSRGKVESDGTNCFKACTELKYIRKKDGIWNVENLIDGQDNVWRMLHGYTNKGGREYFVYSTEPNNSNYAYSIGNYPKGNRLLKVGVRENDTWRFMNVGNEEYGSMISVDADNNGGLHIAFGYFLPDKTLKIGNSTFYISILKYAYWDGSAWKIEVVDE